VNETQELLVVNLAHCTAQLETVFEAVHSELKLELDLVDVVLVGVVLVEPSVGSSLSGGPSVTGSDVQLPTETPNILIQGK
jgi:hypothetical protein